MKYIKQKVIKGQPYYYFEYPLQINKRKYTYTKYLGRELPHNLDEKFSGYFQEIAIFVADKVKEKSRKYFPPNGVKTIELAKFKYRLLNHELFRKDLRLFRTLFYMLFMLNSNRAEGSKVTLPDIEEAIKKRIKPKSVIEKEIMNSIDAINFSFSKKMKWNEKSIKTIHKYLFWNIHPEIAGKYKKVNNIVANSPTTLWKEVPKEIKRLLHWFKENKRKKYPPLLVLEFHWRFEAVHPFEDGNGRVGRILLNAFLVEQGYSPVIFFSENHKSYCNAIAKAREGKTIALAKHYVESVKKTERAIKNYQLKGIIKGGSSKIGKWEIQRGKIRIS